MSEHDSRTDRVTGEVLRVMNADPKMTDPRKVRGRGEKYYCGYWRQSYTYLGFWDGQHHIQWSDGRMASHRTGWDHGRDRLVVTE